VKSSETISIFLGGDVMTGRGIDQVLPYPGDPALYESYVRDAREYVELAEMANGPIIEPVDFDYTWGDALEELERAGTDVRIINLETSITESEDYWPNKEVLYRMHPRNIGCLTAARIDCCCLANNHVLDWGYRGLQETLRTLEMAGIARAGAGENAAAAGAPAALGLAGRGRVLVFSLGSTTSGVLRKWGATEEKPGVNLLEDLSEDTAHRIAGQMLRQTQPRDVTIFSIHWGDNWGYDIPAEQINFAHRLIEEGVSIVHGHSSHHVKAIEVYLDRLILYGCGDLLTDYEGIGGYEEFRSDLALIYLAKFDAEHNRLIELRLVPFRVRQFRLHRASAADDAWLRDTLNRLGAPFGTRAPLEGKSTILLWK
jgi:poly-gamma-glutamate capsule biosynthesis protein CapA/YwtB (metallophosphatase superfamily)